MGVCAGATWGHSCLPRSHCAVYLRVCRRVGVHAGNMTADRMS